MTQHPSLRPTLPTCSTNHNELCQLITASLAAAERHAARLTEQFQAARDHQHKLQAEQRAARTTYQPVHTDTWWDHATPHDLANIIQTAATWAPHDLAALYAMATITDQLQARTGLNLDTLVNRSGSIGGSDLPRRLEHAGTPEVPPGNP